MDDTTPTLFVARDRARTYTRRIKDALTERRLAYQDVGMTSLVNEAEASLGEMLRVAEETIAALRVGTIRDRERGYTEMPLVAMSEAVMERVRWAQKMDRAVQLGDAPATPGQRQVVALLTDALRRIDAFIDAYDAKRPVAPARVVDVSHMLELIERDYAWVRHLAGDAHADAPNMARRPPDLVAPAEPLDDVLRAARALLPLARGPWRCTQAEGMLELRLGTAEEGDESLPLPQRLEAAQSILAFRMDAHVQVLGISREGGGLLTGDATTTELHEIAVHIPLPKPASKDVDTERLLSGDIGLAQHVERAVQALDRAGPLSPQGSPPPDRLIAWMGLFTALEAELTRVVVGRSKSSAARVMAGRLPRDDTRKAPPKRAVLDALASAYPQLPVERVDAVVKELASGRLARSRAKPGDAAVVLAVIGRTWGIAGADLRQAIVLAPLDEGEVSTLIGELIAIAAARKTLDGGGAFELEAARTMEASLLNALGLLGRVAE